MGKTGLQPSFPGAVRFLESLLVAQLILDPADIWVMGLPLTPQGGSWLSQSEKTEATPISNVVEAICEEALGTFPPGSLAGKGSWQLKAHPPASYY